MKPFIRGGGVAARIADHYATEHQNHGAVTLAGLAAFYSTTRYTMRRALRMAEPLFHANGLALRVPERDSGWVVVATDDQLAFLSSTMYRFQAMTVECARYATSEAAVADPSATLYIETFVESLSDLIDNLVAATA
jgi:hypothetical protein